MAEENVTQEEKGGDICPEGGVFNCTADGAVIAAKGCARMYSALDGIKTLTAILFQNELDKDCENVTVMSQNTAIGLLNALGSCAEFASSLMDGHGHHSRTSISTP